MRLPRFRSLICILLSILVIAFCVKEIKTYKSEDRKSSEKLQNVQSEIDALEDEKDAVDDKIAEINEILQTDEPEVPNIMICFEGVTDRVYEEFSPVMDQAGLTGTMIFKHYIFPGDDGYISWDNARELCNKGWNIAVGTGEDIPLTDDANTDRDNLREYIGSYSGDMNDYNLNCNAVYFNTDMYRDEYRTLLEDLNIDYAIINDDLPEETGEKITYISASDLQNISQIMENNPDTKLWAIVFNGSEDEDTYNADTLTSLLNDLTASQDQGACKLVSPSDLLSVEDDEEKQKELDSYNKELEELQQKSQDLQDQINSLYKD